MWFPSLRWRNLLKTKSTRGSRASALPLVLITGPIPQKLARARADS